MAVAHSELAHIFPGESDYDVRADAPNVEGAERRRACILLADDNADMRDYVRRLLSPQHEVVAVTDGESAWAAALDHLPDLVLADIMMPRLDGYELLDRLRSDPRTSRLPIILLSASAGEEARVEGLDKGADDYLIKPFSARELLARVNTHLSLAQVRGAAEEVLRRSNEDLEFRVRQRTRELETVVEALRREAEERKRANEALRDSENKYCTLFNSIDEGLSTLEIILDENEKAVDYRFIQVNSSLIRLTGLGLDVIGRRVSEVIPDLEKEWFERFERVVKTGEPERWEIFIAALTGWFEISASRIGGSGSRLVSCSYDNITERKRAEEALRISEKRMRGQKHAFQAAIDGAPLQDSLGILARIVTEETAGAARTAFYIADRNFTCLQPITGAGDMPESYTKQVDGFPIGTESLACGLAIACGRPVLTGNVLEEPKWKPWLHLAKEYDFRGCWSFPIETRDRKPIGTFAMYFREAREAAPHDLALAGVITPAAAIIISRYRLEQEVADRTAELRVRVAERDALLNEVHHRVKNNLQVISSLLEMQANRVENPQAYSQFEDACNRVVSIAIIHEVLYTRGSFAEIGLGDYARDMAERLTAFYGLSQQVKVKVHDMGIALDLDRATSLGLVFNELISNSCKHGFPNGKTGEIIIRLTRGEGRIHVKVADTGIGFVDEPGSDVSLGLGLVRTIVTQNLAGTVELGSEQGAWVAIEMPERVNAAVHRQVRAAASPFGGA
jgi:PAS domain S-box-containing protein